jgi:hypothetical protein
MLPSLKNAAVLSLVVAFAIATSCIAGAAEKKQSYVKSNYITASKSTLALGKGHEVTQEVIMSDIKYSDPDYQTAKNEWVYVHTDSIEGSGKQTGYYVDTHEDGSQTYGTFEGTTKTTVKPDGSWQSTWEGTYQYLGGTGKFESIKGNGEYKGQASSEKPAREEGQEVFDY